VRQETELAFNEHFKSMSQYSFIATKYDRCDEKILLVCAFCTTIDSVAWK